VVLSVDRRAAHVVIVGGGVIGTSIAYHLAMRGMSDVVVLEKGSLGGGSTAKAPGGIRQQFGREVEIRLAITSMKFWREFEERTEVHLEFQQVGYLFLLTTPDEVRDFTARVALQQRLGVPSRLLTPAEVSDIAPCMAMDGILAASYCPTDGRASPANAVYGYTRVARRLGVQLLENIEVRGICTTNGKVTGVETSQGRVFAPIVVNAAGPEAREVAAWVGIDLPVFPKRQHVFVTGPVAGLPSKLPCTMEPTAGLFVAPEGEGVLLTLPPEERSSKNTAVDWDVLAEIATAGARRLPSIANADMQTAWAGLVEMTPDELPILGPVPGVEGFLCANGLSGHGVMLSPAIGKAVAEIVLDGVSSCVDVSGLSFERFRDVKGRR